MNLKLPSWLTRPHGRAAGAAGVPARAAAPAPGPSPSHQTLQEITIRPHLVTGLVVAGCIVVLAYTVWQRIDAKVTAHINEQKTAYREANEIRKDIETQQATQRRLRADESRLRVTREQVANRINLLAQEIGVTPEEVSEKVPAATLVVRRPMLDASAGLKVHIVGPPERVHRYFVQLEQEFPSLAVMQTEIGRVREQLSVQTVYLVPAYAAF